MDKLHQAIVDLACAPEIKDDDFDRAMEVVTSHAAEILDVARCSIWLLNEDNEYLECVLLFDRGTRRHLRDTRRAHRSELPFSEIGSVRVIEAARLQRDETMSEFADRFVTPYGISSVLNAGIRIDGRIVGAVALSHVGAERKWTAEEVDLAAEVADQIAFALLCKDRADLRRLLKQGQRLESIGLLTSGVAHDFNNLLHVIMGHSELLANRIGETPELAHIQAAAARAVSLTRKLRPSKARRDQHSARVNEVVSETAALMRSAIPESVQIVARLSDTDVVADIDPDELGQVIANLCVNARDAIQADDPTTHGRIEIEVSEREGRLSLVVADDGSGMSEAVMRRALEPQFTTKDAEKGSGLGLYVVSQIVSGAGGEVSLASRVGEGTRVQIWLPLQTRSSVVPRIRATREGANTKRVLVLDDDATVVMTTKAGLEQLGYDVIGCVSAEEARAGFAEDVDLVIMDVVLPESSGPELVAEMRRAREVPVLYVSGYQRAQLNLDEAGPTTAFLAKPYNAQDLANALENLALAS